MAQGAAQPTPIRNAPLEDSPWYWLGRMSMSLAELVARLESMEQVELAHKYRKDLRDYDAFIVGANIPLICREEVNRGEAHAFVKGGDND